MPKCVVKKCQNNTRTTKKKDGVTYHRFPVNEIIREKWRKLVARERAEEFFKPNESSVICSDHFLEFDVYCTPKGFKRLKKTAVPHIEFADDFGPNQSKKRGIEEASDVPEVTAAYCDLYCTTDGVKRLKRTTVPHIEVGEENEDDHLIKAQVQNISVSPTRKSTNPYQGMHCHPVLPDFECAEISHKLTATEHGILSSQTTPSGLDSVLNTPKTSHFKKELRKCHRKLQFKDRQVRNLKKQNKRLRKANSSLKEIIQDLKKKRLIDDSLSNDIEKATENNDECIMKILSAKVRKPFSTYPPVLRKFALTLHFYSTAAYQYLRRIFNKSLPHPSTLFRWYKNVNADPGFTDEAFKRLTEKSKQSSEPLICSLIADEMSIRQQRIWTGDKYEGLVDMGIGMDDSDQKASQAFVLLVVSLNQGWTLPIAYFFIQSLTGAMKANIINIALQKCHEARVKIVSLTFDGCKSNINCMQQTKA